MLGLILLGDGLWPLSLLVLGFLVLTSSRGARNNSGPPHAPFRTDRALAVGFFFLSAVALASGGTYSPVVFALLGASALAAPIALRPAHGAALEPLRGSMLLRGRTLPFSYVALAELKFGPGDPAKPVSAVRDVMLVTCDGERRAFLVFRSLSIGGERAAAGILARMGDAARSLSPSGAYLIPLDSGSAAALLSARLTRVGLDASRLFGESPLPPVVLIEPGGPFVRAISAFLPDGSGPARPSLPAAQPVARRPLVWEVANALARRGLFPEPDSGAGFMASLHATSGQPVGERMVSLSEAVERVEVESAGGARASLTREQLRALVAIYP
jgi:hypothetical protein